MSYKEYWKIINVPSLNFETKYIKYIYSHNKITNERN